MPVAVKDLHMASSLKELKETCVIDKKIIKNKPIQKLIESAMKLYSNAKQNFEEELSDEERGYTYLFRAMELWDIIMKSQEFTSDRTYYELMYGKTIYETLTSLEICENKLKERYTALENGRKISEKESLKNQYKLVSTVAMKKRKEEIKEHRSEKINGVKTVITSDEKCLEDYNLKFDTEISKPEADYYGGNKFMECKVLKEKIIGSLHDILIIDIRPKSDYDLSKISSIHCINIPGTLITPGLSANKLRGLIRSSDEKCYWDQRDQYEQLVLLDWHSEQKDVIPGSPLYTLHTCLTKWDPDIIYKNNPLVLNGGFERFLDTYPTFTTNPKIQCPEKPIVRPFIHLSEHNIEYPLNDLDEHVVPPKTKVVLEPVENSAITPTSRPSVDRSTKPNQFVEKMDRSDHAVNNIKPSVRAVETDETSQFIHHEKMEEDKVSHKPTERGDLPTEASKPKERYAEIVHSSNSTIRPSTPPRSDNSNSQHKTHSNKGDGDGDIYLERTKFETPSRGGGLKRSASSPNINKLGEEELNNSSWTPTPSFDRSTKPTNKSSYDFSTRSAGTDTVYMADASKKGRGLTGLKNLGNLCYMNSIMQCISNTAALMRELTKFNVKESSPLYVSGRRQIANEVSQLLRNMWQSETRTTSCRSLKVRVGALRHSFSTMEQQDSHEFLTILVDWLHEDLNEPSSIKSLEGAEESTGEKAWGEFRQKNNSVVVDLLYGQLKSTVTCDYCQTESVLFEPFSNLSIPLPSTQEDKDRTFTLQDCLKLYLKGEPISGWVCPNCKTARKATKKLDITRLPPVLIIHLKRFMNDMVGVGWCRKRMNMVDFQITDLDMRPFTHPESELRFHNYNLYAVSNHYGSMESGHYTAYCKNHSLNKWYKFDDQDVNEISPGEVKSSAAYILFYESSQFDSQNRILD